MCAGGSLTWDPGSVHAEARRAARRGHARRSAIRRDPDRGFATTLVPVVSLEPEPRDTCLGLAFRIPAARVRAETEIHRRRELIVNGCAVATVDGETLGGTERAVCFASNPADPRHAPERSIDDAARTIAAAHGVRGSNRASLARPAARLRALDAVDPSLDEVLRRVDLVG